jgi:hypothetical protein
MQRIGDFRNGAPATEFPEQSQSSDFEHTSDYPKQMRRKTSLYLK